MYDPLMSISHLNEVLSEPSAKDSLVSRFLEKVDVRGSDDCWPWVAKATAKYGYGRMTAGRGRYLRAHQVAWALENGPIPEGKVIRHTCDNPPCCNPKHLLAGTQQENVNDAVSRGRQTRPPYHSGGTHPRAKLTQSQVDLIRASKETLTKCAKRYAVSSKSIWRIRKGLQWKDT